MNTVDKAYKIGQRIAWEGSAVVGEVMLTLENFDAIMAGYREAKEDIRVCPVCSHKMHKSALQDVVWNIYMAYCPECSTAHYLEAFIPAE